MPIFDVVKNALMPNRFQGSPPDAHLIDPEILERGENQDLLDGPYDANVIALTVTRADEMASPPPEDAA